MAEKKTDVFNELFALNVNDKTENRNGLTYLSWSWALAEVMKRFPDMTYEIWRDEQGRPYIADEDLGYMVFTSVTIGGITKKMWLPVMDSNNKAMKKEPYTVKTKYKTINVASATMFDVNKAIMRCLTKNLAMFGLGLYIYSGEDLPEDEKETMSAKEAVSEHKVNRDGATFLEELIKASGTDIEKFKAAYKINDLIELSYEDWDKECVRMNNRIKAKQKEKENERTASK